MLKTREFKHKMIFSSPSTVLQPGHSLTKSTCPKESHNSSYLSQCIKACNALNISVKHICTPKKVQSN